MKICYWYSKEYPNMTVHMLVNGMSVCKLERNKQRIPGRLDTIESACPQDRRKCKLCFKG